MANLTSTHFVMFYTFFDNIKKTIQLIVEQGILTGTSFVLLIPSGLANVSLNVFYRKYCFVLKLGPN